MKFVSRYDVEDTSRATREASPEGVERFRKAGIGLSAHWGLYALSHSGGEWIYFTDQIPLAEYRKRLARFNPTRFCADDWADLMLEAGLKFLLITSKHHDGFCLWDSALTDFKVTNTAFQRDVLQELAAALRARGLGLHFYYSLVDWTHPAYRRDWPAYVAYYHGQLRELCTQFGEIQGILFDGYWPRVVMDTPAEQEYFPARGPWGLAEAYDLIHELQPGAVITNNTHIVPLRGEDYQVWELDLPGENKIGFNGTEIGDKPTACWWNLNAGWSYQPWNHNVKSADDLLATYRQVRAKGATFLLNVGPRSFGDIHPEEQAVLRQIGQAVRRYHL
jgi:alpha-L-fucosidase